MSKGAPTVRDSKPKAFRGGSSRGGFTLVVLASPVEQAVGSVHALGREPVVLHRVDGDGQEDLWMSRDHATVRVAGDDTVELRDGSETDEGWRDSANGTWRLGKQLDGPIVLGVGDWFRTGRTLWMVTRGSEEPPDESLLAGVSRQVVQARLEIALVVARVARRLQRGKRVTQSLLVTGPRGAGKQVVAHEAHRLLDGQVRGTVPFFQVSSPALADGTASADLFGVVAGYATDVKARAGYFELANRGVLLLDEVGDTPASEQAKLLNVLQEREVMRLGARASVPFDCLVVAATNHELEQGIEDGTFRADLYDRLARFAVAMPQLGERREDIPLLAAHLLHKHGCAGTFDWEVVQLLLARDWPGNVRELDIFVERVVAMTDAEEGADITVQDADLALRNLDERRASTASKPQPRPDRPSPRTSTGGRQRPERAELLEALRAAGWNKSEVARQYGKHPRQVTRWMEYLEIDPE